MTPSFNKKCDCTGITTSSKGICLDCGNPVATTPKNSEWEEEFDDLFTRRGDCATAYAEDFWGKEKVVMEEPATLKDFIRSLLQERSKDTVGEMVKKEAVLKILTDEINLAHTTESGKTSRLTSAYNRIIAL